MPRAVNMLRPALVYRRECFDEGLRAAGFDVVPHLDRPGAGDVLVTWNAYGAFGEEGRRFRQTGARHLVIENGCLGKHWQGGEWFSVALDAVALTGGTFKEGGPERWDRIGEDLQPWCGDGETVILGQRGIGAHDVRSSDRWAESVRGRIGGRIRQHPGTGPAVSLAADLKKAGRVVTWSSAAALQALVLGIPVWYAHPAFVGAEASKPLARWPGDDMKDDAARLAIFRRLAWCVWTLDEIRSGEALRWVLQ